MSHTARMLCMASIVLFMVLAALPQATRAATDQGGAATHGEVTVDHATTETHHNSHDGDLHHQAEEIGKELGVLWVIPFVCMLLSIAIFPLTVPHFWHHNFGKVSAFWSLAFLVPFTLQYGFSLALYEVCHTMFLEYIPFIILLFALFTVAGGVRLTGQLVGKPVVNLGVLVVGTILASWMGTTGAAMLLIRPLLRANAHRKYKVHTVVFFIFLVANIGGSLTPLGDPPLFLGFLKGVKFFWTTVHMFIPMVFVSVILLVLYLILDTMLYAKEGKPVAQSTSDEKIGLEGKINLLFLVGIIGGVLMSGMWHSGIHFDIYHVSVDLQNVTRDLILLFMAFLSLKFTSAESRRKNDFDWFPIVEVAKLFAGIFISMIPAIAILRAGMGGALKGVISMVSTPAGDPVNPMYFWLTGVLSSFLDNAPTYLVFFNTAGGDAVQLMGPLEQTLLAISAGAVFMGANTYIGNAPNFMVRSIAETSGVKMPSFFGYMAWSGGILIPIFVLVNLVFF